MTVTEPRRADARRNRERVITAAAEVFAEQGIEAGIPEVAERAGVGKGTVYRNFETKEDLVAAVQVERIRAWRKRLCEEAETGDPWSVLTAYLFRAATRLATDRSTDLSAGRVSTNPALLKERAELNREIDSLLDLAKAQGKVRSDVTSADIRVLFGGISRILNDDGVKDPETWRRYAGMVVDSLRA
ncbi:MAG: TetR/AcrR family transcriptional regulator [Actinomycetota bacterium]|nr:TetR/AcrR family transcriptional regulator [Actinomycetota bacterium]